MNEAPRDDYFQRRAEEERAASERAIDKRAAQAHRELAEEYRKRAGAGRISTIEEPARGIVAKGFQIIP
jgi:hypothetical protein